MSDKSKRKHKPEDMLLRIIRVAEILAEGSDTSLHKDRSYEDCENEQCKSTQKTQI